MTVRVRFAPSPTGYLHVGGARTALYNWLFARHYQGVFILRIEDTDTERSTQASIDAILEGMSWLGLNWDEGPVRQGERGELYRHYSQKLIELGKAYYCVCTPGELEARRKEALARGQSPRYDGRCRSLGLTQPRPGAALRFLNQTQGQTVVDDLVHGPMTFENKELADFIIVRADGLPVYNFAAAIDDAEMKITHVIRGDDHISNTPRQILLYRALDLPLPQFAHIPMILGGDKTRLSKRHGATSVLAYREMGFLPEALINYLARLGWAHGDQEIFSLEELVQYFTLEKVGKTPAVFDQKKLLWLNSHYIKTASASRLAALMKERWQTLGFSSRGSDHEIAIIKSLQERAKTLVELTESSSFYFQPPAEYDPKGWAKFWGSDKLATLKELFGGLGKLPDFSEKSLEEFYRTLAEKTGVKMVDLAQATRMALIGKTVSPPIFEVVEIVGKEEVLSRLEKALAKAGALPK